MNKSEFKICAKCKEEKPLSEFYKLVNGYYRSYCKPCQNQRRKDRYHKNPKYQRERNRAYKLSIKYNITEKDYDDLYQIQNGKCAICNTHQKDLKRRLDVDHDHITGEVRGLLCVNCNVGIGLLKDDSKLLIKAAGYLNN